MKYLEKYRNKVVVFVMLSLLMILSVVYTWQRQRTTHEFVSDDLMKIEETVVSETSESEEILQDIIVDIKGAVKLPGVYQMTTQDRVIDLIEKAGGILANGDTETVNLAQKLTDQMSITILDKNQVQELSTNNGEGIDSANKELQNFWNISSQTSKIDINTADISQLETLPGIGPSKANAIVTYREEHGSFQSIEDIQNVTGIGAKTYEKLQESIQVGGLP